MIINLLKYKYKLVISNCIFLEGIKMKNKDLIFDRNCHSLYSKKCEKEIKKKIALHYPKELQEKM